MNYTSNKYKLTVLYASRTICVQNGKNSVCTDETSTYTAVG